jgi:VanZ family protein
VVFGIGAGLTLDEFALWLNLRDVYWSEEGRRSIDAVIFAATLSGIALVGLGAFVDAATEVKDVVISLGTAGLALFVLVGSVAAIRRSRSRRVANRSIS